MQPLLAYARDVCDPPGHSLNVRYPLDTRWQLLTHVGLPVIGGTMPSPLFN